MKIGILTFHRALNYGATLQCFALQKYLLKLGYDVEVIDYRQSFIEKVYKVWNSSFFKKNFFHTIKILKYIYRLPYRYKRKKLFKHFINENLNLSRPCYSTIPTGYDIVFHGSDQIWNSKLTGGKLDPIYMGCYQLKKDSQKVSYAASFEDRQLTNDEAFTFKSMLANFNKISVRESGLIERLSPLTQKTIYNVVDPTLLLTASDYDLIATKPKVKNKYVLFYAVGPTEEALKLAHRIAKERQCQLIDITNKQISPNEFLGYFKYATFAVVVSFHGTVFSLMYKTNFYTYATGTTSDIRYYNLLDGLNMGDRCIKAMPQTIEDVDFSKLDKKMQQFTAFSKDYINDVIQQSPSDK